MISHTPLRTRSLSTQKWLVFAALLTVAACAIGLWFLLMSPLADTARTAQPDIRALEPVIQPTPASGQPPEPLAQADPFSTAAVRQRSAVRGAASGSTDCVALMAVFEGATARCTTAKDSQHCILTSVKDEGFEPATYDMCKLFRPAP